MDDNNCISVRRHAQVGLRHQTGRRDASNEGEFLNIPKVTGITSQPSLEWTYGRKRMLHFTHDMMIPTGSTTLPGDFQFVLQCLEAGVTCWNTYGT